MKEESLQTKFMPSKSVSDIMNVHDFSFLKESPSCYGDFHQKANKLAFLKR